MPLNLQYFFCEKNSGKNLRQGEKFQDGTSRGDGNQGITAQETGFRDGSIRKAAARGQGIAVCMVQEELKPEAVLAGLRERCPELVDSSWFGVESPLASPGNCALLREADGILLAVKARCHAGRQLEYVLEYLEQQDCRVTAVVLWEADEKLIRRYYFGRERGTKLSCGSF